MLAKPGSKIIEHKPYLFRLQQKVFFRLVQVNNTKKSSQLCPNTSHVLVLNMYELQDASLSPVLVRHAVPSQVRQLFWLRQKREENSDSKLKIKVLFLMRVTVHNVHLCSHYAKY